MGIRASTWIMLLLVSVLLALGAAVLAVVSQNPHAVSGPLFVYGS